MSKNNSLIINFAWKFAERISAQLVTFIVSVILARLLEPSHYGIIAMVMVFITITNVLVQDGFGSALIQKKNADDLDFSSVLVANLCLSIFLYLILFFTAPLISTFYNEKFGLLVPIIRILGLRIILSALNSVQHAYISRIMNFKKFFWATLYGTILSAFLGILLAYHGFGVWALVAQYLTNTLIDTIVLQISIKKFFKLQFSFERLKGLFKFSWKILGASLLNNGYQEFRTLLIGKIYSSADLAYYSRGKQFPELLVININTSIGSVLFPKMSTVQDDTYKIKEITRQSIRFSSYILTPMLFGLAAIANPFINFLLTEKWLFVVPFLQMYCLFYLVQPIHTANMQAIKALGRSDIFLKLELVKKAIELIILLLCIKVSVIAIVVSATVLNWLFIFVNSYPNRKLLRYTISEQLKDIFSPIAMGFVMVIVVTMIGKIKINPSILLIVQIFSGIITYILLSYFSKNKEFMFLISKIKYYI